MRYILILLVLFLFSDLHAQKLEGVISDASGRPLKGVTIYVEELRQGFITDENGEFQAKVVSGKYSLVCKKLGYEEFRQEIIISDQNRECLRISLKDNPFFEHKHKLSGDTIARRIIGEIIQRAPEYRYSVSSYKAGAYIKGQMILGEVPSFTNMVIKKLEHLDLSEYQNKTLYQEMYSEVEFSSPDNYNTIVKGYAGSITDQFNFRGAVNILDESVFSSEFNAAVSPLNPKAFFYYSFEYEGYYLSGGQVCHKVKVKSKLKDPELLNGYLYINGDGTISFAELVKNWRGVKQAAIITYHKFKENVILPVSYYLEMHFNILGTTGNISYLTSMKYENIHFKSEEDIIPRYRNYYDRYAFIERKAIVDSLASVQTEDFWRNVRVVPYTSLDTVKLAIGAKDSFNKPWVAKILFGDYIYGNPQTENSLSYGGLKMVFRDYNYVDGFWLGQKFDMFTRLDNGKSIEFSPYIYYTTARHRVIFRSDLTFNYLPEKNADLRLSIGSHTADFNELSLSRYNNYFYSLLLGKNYNSFFQKDHITLTNRLDLADNLRLTTSVGVERRSGLDNRTEFTLLDINTIKANINPGNRFDRTFYSMGLSYAPLGKYSTTQNEAPLVFHAQYQEGFSAWQTNNSRYRRLKAAMIQNIPVNYFNMIDYKIEGGVYIGSKKNLHFADYQFFGAPDLIFNLSSLFDSFLLLDNYELRANNCWANFSFNYSGDYILLKLLPFLQGKPFYEALHIKHLYTPGIHLYTEMGYSLNVTRLFGMGAFVSFQDERYKNWGVRFSFNLQSLRILRD